MGLTKTVSLPMSQQSHQETQDNRKYTTEAPADKFVRMHVRACSHEYMPRLVLSSRYLLRAGMWTVAHPGKL